MNKTILTDIALLAILILNLLKPNVYIGYLVTLISILTIIYTIIMFFGYIGIENIDKKTKKKLKDYLKNQGKVFKTYQYIANIGLTILLALNGLIATAVIYTLAVAIISAFKEKINDNRKSN